MEREEALRLLKEYIKNENLVKHCIATAAIMKEIARVIGEDEKKWEIVGLLHDIDYEVVEGDMSKHGIVGAEILKQKGLDDEICEVVKTHNHTIFGDTYSKPIEFALQAADSISGLIVACALVKGKNLSNVTVKTIKKKFKEKSFAAGCDRNRIKQIENIGISLENFFEIALRGMLKVKDELGL